MKVLCFVGKAGSGKDTAANAVMKTIAGLERFRWADALKDVASLVYGWDRARLDDDLDYKEEVPLHPDGTFQCPGGSLRGLSRREVLQQLGTNCFRWRIAEDTWLRAAHRRMGEIEEFHSEYVGTKSRIVGWVNPDTRFLNEAEYAREHFDTLIVRVNRIGATQGTDSGAHASETELDEIEADVTLAVADGAIETLQQAAVMVAREFFV
jgi:hypothetical protein